MITRAYFPCRESLIFLRARHGHALRACCGPATSATALSCLATFTSHKHVASLFSTHKRSYEPTCASAASVDHRLSTLTVPTLQAFSVKVRLLHKYNTNNRTLRMQGTGQGRKQKRRLPQEHLQRLCRRRTNRIKWRSSWSAVCRSESVLVLSLHDSSLTFIADQGTVTIVLSDGISMPGHTCVPLQAQHSITTLYFVEHGWPI